jgi:hypothetical protein
MTQGLSTQAYHVVPVNENAGVGTRPAHGPGKSREVALALVSQAASPPKLRGVAPARPFSADHPAEITLERQAHGIGNDLRSYPLDAAHADTLVTN